MIASPQELTLRYLIPQSSAWYLRPQEPAHDLPAPSIRTPQPHHTHSSLLGELSPSPYIYHCLSPNLCVLLEKTLTHATTHVPLRGGSFQNTGSVWQLHPFRMSPPFAVSGHQSQTVPSSSLETCGFSPCPHLFDINNLWRWGREVQSRPGPCHNDSATACGCH